MRERRTPARLAIAASAASLALVACAEIRLLTYPSEFVFLDDESVQDTMHGMAASLATLDRLVAAASVDPENPVLRGAIETELRGLEDRASALGVGSALEVGERAVPRTNHLLIDEHIDVFLDDIARARRLAAQAPPSYYPIGTLVGGCNACHAAR